MEFERVLRAIGGFGLFNKTVIPVMLVLTAWHTAVSYLGRVLVVVAPPSQWCFAEDLGTAIQALDVANLPRGRCQFVDERPMVMEDGSYTNVSIRQDTTATCPTGWRYDNAEYFTTVTMEATTLVRDIASVEQWESVLLSSDPGDEVWAIHLSEDAAITQGLLDDV